jgi:hypothetical protein
MRRRRGDEPKKKKKGGNPRGALDSERERAVNFMAGTFRDERLRLEDTFP